MAKVLFWKWASKFADVLGAFFHFCIGKPTFFFKKSENPTIAKMLKNDTSIILKTIYTFFEYFNTAPDTGNHIPNTLSKSLKIPKSLNHTFFRRRRSHSFVWLPSSDIPHYQGLWIASNKILNDNEFCGERLKHFA
jgi:hypothetical protein